MSTMNEARFHDLVDALQQQVEDAFDDSDLDLDLENAGGVLTVRFENGSQLILSRQAPLRQLWVAAKSGGFHFDYDEASGLWRHDGSQEPLGALLNRATLEQGGARMSSSPVSEASPPVVASPCRRLCCLDDADVCVGCDVPWRKSASGARPTIPAACRSGHRPLDASRWRAVSPDRGCC